MKITFSNLGAIKKTTLDLRPLTVIIGPNNSNKTYIAYSIYGLWKGLDNEFPTISSKVGKISYQDENTWSIKISDFVNFFIAFRKQAIKSFIGEMSNFFQDSSYKLFTQTQFEIEVSKVEVEKTLYRLVNERKFHFTSVMGSKVEFDVNEKHLFIKFTNTQLKDDAISFHYISGALSFVLMEVASFLFPTPFLLPAERNAFVITYKILASKRLKHLRMIQRGRISERSKREIELLKEQGDINYPEPIEDFLDFLTDVEFEKDTDGNLENRGKFSELAKEIEESIQGKNKTNFKLTRLGGKELKINVKKGLDIDLYNASSSIKQLAPLLLYLRYRAQENDLLIIDEPEMNLHPESQAKLLEVLGMLVNAGVNVLLTTHSPYFMSHLNNLISGDMTNDETRETQAKSLYLEDARAFLKPEDVSAYEMREKAGNQTLHDLKDEDYGIRWDTLSDVSGVIQQKYFEIYEKGKKSSDGEEES